MPVKRAYSDHGDACATAHAMELLGDRWTYPVLRELMLAPKRFTELAQGVRGVTPAVLTARLRELESVGLVERVQLPAPARGGAYRVTAWGQELRPVFDSLGRWAQASPVWRPEGCGLTPDAIVQSMLTMAPAIAFDPPVELELRLHDGRTPGSPEYTYRLHWDGELSITRGVAPAASATVTGDSSTWTGVLYDGVPLDGVQVDGDETAVQRVVAAFSN